MDFCIECELPLDECMCVEQRAEMEVDTFIFITRQMGFAIRATAR